MTIRASEALKRAWHKTCPACGKAGIFERGLQLHEFCPACGLTIRAREQHTWFFMYFSTAGITGVFLLAMFMINSPYGFWIRVGLMAAALPSFFLTIPLRKSIAIALDYLVPDS